MATTHASERRHWFIAWSPLRNQYKPKSATTCGSRIKTTSKTMIWHRFAFFTLTQQCGKIPIGRGNFPDGGDQRAFNPLLTNRARATVADGSRRAGRPARVFPGQNPV